MNYYYSPEELIKGEILNLNTEESHHAIKVLRLSVNDTVHIINGRGQVAEAEIIGIINREVKVFLQKVNKIDKPRPTINLALALIKKKERLEWEIEKAVELGASEILIFTSDHSEKKNADVKRLEKIAVTALKQSGNFWLPEIKTGLSFQDIVNLEFKGQKFIAHCENTDNLHLKNAYRTGENCIVLIGPEGDFSSREIQSALSHDFIPVSLGQVRLRAETAGIVSLVILQVSNVK